MHQINFQAFTGMSQNRLFLFRLFTGLLIEPEPEPYQALLAKNRKVKSLNVCLSVRNTPQEVEFMNKYVVGGIKGITQKRSK